MTFYVWAWEVYFDDVIRFNCTLRHVRRRKKQIKQLEQMTFYFFTDICARRCVQQYNILLKVTHYLYRARRLYYISWLRHCCSGWYHNNMETRSNERNVEYYVHYVRCRKKYYASRRTYAHRITAGVRALPKFKIEAGNLQHLKCKTAVTNIHKITVYKKG